MKFTLISDTHSQEKKLNKLLSEGDAIIHAGDFMTDGRDINQLKRFLKWFNGLEDYDDKIMIAGNHDFFFEESEEEEVYELLHKYEDIIYLQDSGIKFVQGKDVVSVWGSPWQPEFHNWAFNLPRNSWELEKVWSKIPMNTDILITHGPPQEILDSSGHPHNEPLLGCNLLAKRVLEVRPKIHIFGHIHGSYGYKFSNDVHYFNASMLNENYDCVNKPFHIDWNPVTNEIEFCDV